MKLLHFRKMLLCISAIPMAGCGLQTPSMNTPLRPGEFDVFLVNLVIHLKKELKCTVYALEMTDSGYRSKRGRVKNLPWLHDAVAKVTLNLTINEKTSFSPSISGTSLISNSIARFPFGGDVTTGRSITGEAAASLSAEANRILSVDYTFSVGNDLLVNEPWLKSNCNPFTGEMIVAETGTSIQGNLRLGEAFVSLLKPYTITNPATEGIVGLNTAPENLQSDITFTFDTVLSGGPIWKLVPVSYFTAGNPLLTGSRRATDEVIVTIGKGGTATDTAHNIRKNGSSVATALIAAQ